MRMPKVSSPHLRHALRTALAAVVTYALGTALGVDQSYWAVISVIIVMQANLGGSIQAGVNASWAQQSGQPWERSASKFSALKPWPWG